MKPAHYIIIVLITFISTKTAICQNTVVSVNDQSSKSPVENIALQNLSENRTYYSDRNGKINLADPKEEFRLVVNQIGYFKDTFDIKIGEFNKIFIRELTYSIPSFEISASEQPLIQRVLDAIQINYPTKTEFLTGETKEKVVYYNHGFVVGDYYSNIETVTAKSSYKKTYMAGPVWMNNIVDTIRNIPDSLQRVKFIAGHHNTHRFDFVKRRGGPLDKSTRNQYSVATEELDDQFKIVFFSHKEEGFILVNKDDLAIKYGYFKVKGEMKGDEDYKYQSSGKRSYLVYETFYKKPKELDDFYRIDSIYYRSEMRSDTLARKVHNQYKLTSVTDERPKELRILDLNQYEETIFDFVFAQADKNQQNENETDGTSHRVKKRIKPKRKSYIGVGIATAGTVKGLTINENEMQTTYSVDDVSYILTTGSEIVTNGSTSLSYFISFDPSDKGFTNTGLEALLKGQLGQSFSTIGLKARIFHNVARFSINDSFTNESIFPLSIEGEDYLQDDLNINIKTNALAIGASIQFAFQTLGDETLGIELGYDYSITSSGQYLFKEKDAGFLKRKNRANTPINIANEGFRYPISIKIVWLSW